jgi:hypothetical protein
VPARRAIVQGIVLVALGLIAIVEALRLKDDWQGAKLMPAVIGAVLVVLGVAHFRLREARAPWPDAASAARVLLIFGTLALYVAALPGLGFLLSTALFVLVVIRTLGEFSWPRTAVATVLIAGSSHVVFKHWLGMALPIGPLGF